MLPSAALLAIATFFIILGHDGRRVAQLLVLFLPAVLWMAWPVRTAGMRQLRRVAVVLLTLAFAADGMVRAYLMETYQSAPDSATVLGALANTNAREMAEYMGMHWHTALLGLAMVLGTGALVWRTTAPADHAGSAAPCGSANTRRKALSPSGCLSFSTTVRVIESLAGGPM